MNICQLGAGLFHVDGQTDMTKLKSLFAILRTRLTNMTVTLLHCLIRCHAMQAHGGMDYSSTHS